MSHEMTVPIKLRLPHPPNFLALEVPMGDAPGRKMAELPTLYVGDLTPEQAEEVADRMRDAFLVHARECRETRRKNLAGATAPRCG